MVQWEVRVSVDEERATAAVGRAGVRPWTGQRHSRICYKPDPQRIAIVGDTVAEAITRARHRRPESSYITGALRRESQKQLRRLKGPEDGCG